MLSREKLTNATDDDLAEMLDEIMDFETTKNLQAGKFRSLVESDAKAQMLSFSTASRETAFNVFREAALRWEESRN